MAEDLLAELGCRVVSASSGDEALAKLEGETVDLLFSDVVMPGMSGIELAKTVKERHPDLPVVLATGYSRDLLSGAADDFSVVAKPYGPTDLSRAMTPLLQAGARL